MKKIKEFYHSIRLKRLFLTTHPYLNLESRDLQELEDFCSSDIQCAFVI